MRDKIKMYFPTEIFLCYYVVTPNDYILDIVILTTYLISSIEETMLVSLFLSFLEYPFKTVSMIQNKGCVDILSNIILTWSYFQIFN